MVYFPYRTIVAYKTEEYAEKWIEDFVAKYPNAVQRIRRDYIEKVIWLNDGSIINLMVADERLRGHKVNAVYVEHGVDRDILDTIIYPIAINRNVFIDE